MSYTSRINYEKHPTALVHERFAPDLVHRLSRAQFDVQSLSSVASYVSALRIFNRSLLEGIESQLLTNLHNARVSDMAVICNTLNNFNFSSKCGRTDELFEAVLKELPKRKEETQRHPQMLMECASHLAERNFYDAECIDMILGLAPEYVNTEAVSSLLNLNAFAAINLNSTYNGMLLSYENRRAMAKHLHQTECFHSDFIQSVRTTVGEIYRHCVCIYPAAHFKEPGQFLA